MNLGDPKSFHSLEWPWNTRNSAFDVPAPIAIPTKSARHAAKYFERIHGITPILPLERFERNGIEINLWGKFENVQAVYTFKARGAEYFIHHIAEQYHNKSGFFRVRKNQPENGTDVDSRPFFVTASAGNHAQGVALAADRHKFGAYVFMPKSAPEVKWARVKELGAKIMFVEGTFNDALEAAWAFKEKSENRIFVHPYDHPDIMAGQATVGVEILSQALRMYHPDYLKVAKDYRWALETATHLPDAILCGLGGGGMVSGIGAVVKEFNAIAGTSIKVIGVQSDAADSMYQSLKAGKLMPSSDLEAVTIADGIAVKKALPRMVATVRDNVSQVVVVDEGSIRKGIGYIAKHPGLENQRWRTHEVNEGVPHRALPLGAQHVTKARRVNRVEGAAAAPYAAAFFGDKHGELDWSAIANGKKKINVVCVLSGGNIIREKWSEIVQATVRDEPCAFARDMAAPHDTPTVRRPLKNH